MPQSKLLKSVLLLLLFTSSCSTPKEDEMDISLQAISLYMADKDETRNDLHGWYQLTLQQEIQVNDDWVPVTYNVLLQYIGDGFTFISDGHNPENITTAGAWVETPVTDDYWPAEQFCIADNSDPGILHLYFYFLLVDRKKKKKICMRHSLDFAIQADKEGIDLILEDSKINSYYLSD